MSDLPVYEVATGEVFDLPLEFVQKVGATLTETPIDLTGATVYFTAKIDLADTDAEAIIDAKVTEHDDPEAGETSVPIDLDGVAAGRLTADIWLKDSQGARRSYGRLILNVSTAVTSSTAD